MDDDFARWGHPTESDLASYALLVSQAFGNTLDQSARWIGRVGAHRARVVLGEGEVVAGLTSYDMGLFYGGRSLPCAGVAGVVVRPDARRRGLASAMMRRLLLEAHGDGVPLSALYAASHPLYRGVGFECAGSRHIVAITPDRVGITERGGRVRPLLEADDETRRALYREVAARRPGHLDREAGLWRRCTHDRDDRRHEAWLVLDDGGRPAGYVTLERRGGAGLQQVLGVLDLVATSPWALRRLLCFLGDFASVVGELQLTTAPADPLRFILPEPRLRVIEHWVMLLRIVSLVPALEGRGWPAAAAGQVDLEVEDALLPGNAGRWILEVAGGAARVRRGGAGAVRVGPRGLAALYSGFVSPDAAVQAGLLAGPEEQLAVLGTLLAGPAPWVVDAF